MPECQNSVIYAAVNGFVEKKSLLSVDYLFVVEIFWSDSRTTFVKRKYKDFLQFHKRIAQHYRSQKAEDEFAVPVQIPNIVGTWPFQRATRDLAEKREDELHDFLKKLLHGNPMVKISCNKIVVDFFLPRPSDPVPYREPQDDASSDKRSRDSDIHSDDEYILFSR